MYPEFTLEEGIYMPDNTHVPSKLEGYMLQVRHALYELISLEDRVVSVEAYDDVAVETEDTVIAEQMKSVLSGNNPTANRAIDFWKTIKNWCDYIKSKELPDKNLVLKYVIVASHGLSLGAIPQSFSDSDDEVSAKKALDEARSALLGDIATGEVKTLGEDLRPYIDYCFVAENEQVVCKVISLMKIDVHEETYDDELIARFNHQPIPPEYTDVLFYAMLGWVTDQVHQFTKQNKPAYISSADYQKALIAQIRSKNQSSILSAISVSPTEDDMLQEVERHDTYIRQLELIDMEVPNIYQAASDFLRTGVEKTEWGKRGIVIKENFEDYNDSLKRIWDARVMLANNQHYDDDIKKGKGIYAQCSVDVQNIKLQGATTPSFFGNGTLHTMANEPNDCPLIGWHPDYKEKLKEGG